MITKIENYYLNQPIYEASGLKEYTTEEYQMFEMAGYKRMFRDEKIFSGNKVEFAGITWDGTNIASTNNKIYKINLQFMTQNKNLVKTIFRTTLSYLIEHMGKYSEHPSLSKKYIWDAPEGNFIYEQLNKFGQYCINIFITSSSIKEQVEDYVSAQKIIADTNILTPVTELAHLIMELSFKIADEYRDILII